MATVTFERATRIYPGLAHPAVADLDLEIEDGEFVCARRPVRLREEHDDPDAGRARVHHRRTVYHRRQGRLSGDAAEDRDIAMVFQNYALYPHMTVGDNIGFHLKLKKTPKAEIAERVKEAAGLLDLTEYLDRKPANLSGGQRQRVAMGRAIVRHPSVFLMDEPLSNLDAKLRVQTRSQIARCSVVSASPRCTSPTTRSRR